MNRKKYVLAGILALTVNACSHSPVEKEVTAQANAEPARPLHGGVARKGFESITNSESLTPEQKTKLSDLHKDMIAKTFAIQEETSKLKSVLFETITAKPYRADKVNEVKKRLTTLNDEKMKNMFNALKETEKILGVLPGEERKNIYREIFSDRMVSEQM